MNGNKAADTEQFSFSQQTRRRILTEYVECLYEACQVLRFPARLLDYSNREQQLAYDRRICEGAVLELAYRLSRRHANQETLGAFFHGLPRLAA